MGKVNTLASTEPTVALAARSNWLAYASLPIATCMTVRGLIVAANPAFAELFQYEIANCLPLAESCLTSRGTPLEASEEPCPLRDRAGRTKWCQLHTFRDGDATFWIFKDASELRALREDLLRLEDRFDKEVAKKTVAVRRANQEYRRELERLRLIDVGLTQSREKYRVLFRNSQTGIMFIDDSGEISQINPAMQRLVGARNPVDFRRLATLPVCQTEDVQENTSLSEIARHLVLEMVGEQSCLVKIERPGLNEVWLKAQCTRMHVKDFSAALTFRNVTDAFRSASREAEQRRQLNRLGRISLADHLGSAVAHELGQPLNACMSYAGGLENILRAEDVPYRVHHGLAQLRSELTRASNVLKSMKRFVSNQAPASKPVKIKDLAQQTHDLLDATLSHGEVNLQVELSVDDDATFTGSDIEIQQVLVNLVMNAFDAAEEVQKERLSITISIMQTFDGMVECQVIDNGPGISGEVLDTMFEPYQTTKSDGLGLGLPMCQNIVEAHGGRIWAETTAGEGATFHFTIPLTIGESS